MTIAMMAWVFRFGLFAYGDPAGNLWMIILSCVVYGMAFDFFNISGSLFVESTTTPQNRSSAQGLFMMMTNGVGAVLGSLVSGWMIDRYFTKSFQQLSSVADYVGSSQDNGHLLDFIKTQGISINANGELSKVLFMKDWTNIWLSFTIYALIITVLFMLFFKHQHQPDIDNAAEYMKH